MAGEEEGGVGAAVLEPAPTPEQTGRVRSVLQGARNRIQEAGGAAKVGLGQINQALDKPIVIGRVPSPDSVVLKDLYGKTRYLSPEEAEQIRGQLAPDESLAPLSEIRQPPAQTEIPPVETPNPPTPAVEIPQPTRRFKSATEPGVEGVLINDRITLYDGRPGILILDDFGHQQEIPYEDQVAIIPPTPEPPAEPEPEPTQPAVGSRAAEARLRSMAQNNLQDVADIVSKMFNQPASASLDVGQTATTELPVPTLGVDQNRDAFNQQVKEHFGANQDQLLGVVRHLVNEPDRPTISVPVRSPDIIAGTLAPGQKEAYGTSPLERELSKLTGPTGENAQKWIDRALDQAPADVRSDPTAKREFIQGALKRTGGDPESIQRVMEKWSREGILERGQTPPPRPAQPEQTGPSTQAQIEAKQRVEALRSMNPGAVAQIKIEWEVLYGEPLHDLSTLNRTQLARLNDMIDRYADADPGA